MFDLSQKAADQLYAWSGLWSVIGAIIVFLAAAGLVWSGTVREKYAEIRQSNNEVKIAQADARAAEASEHAAKLERETEFLRTEAEQARAETARVNERIQKMQSIRRLTSDQASRIADFLKSPKFLYDPEANLRVASVGETEAQMYAMDFLTLFKSLNVNIYPTPGGNLPNEIIQVEPSDTDINLRASPDVTDNPNHRYALLLNIMSEIGIKVTAEIDPTLKPNEAQLSILRKPN
ncbi:hypothetical protein QU926_18580 [Pseudomonas asiatica]|uniref:hypothetical protein n=1 Tax=Pseudomonas asiatica TaxID=2219225 RepID=UPI0025AB4440|nr:hypothetical protein [Pseudomonas asiatica]MDM9555630.1 hypothetical protein [Pseudomonas asiatica]